MLKTRSDLSKSRNVTKKQLNSKKKLSFKWLLRVLTRWLPAYSIIVLRFRPKKQQFFGCFTNTLAPLPIALGPVHGLKWISQSSSLHSKKFW